MDTATQNHVFSRLWDQTATETDRQLERARNNQGRRAIKFKTEGLRKVLILEADHRPGFEVRLFDIPALAGVLSTEGVVTFADPLETASLELLIKQIDRWVVAYETIFGDPTNWRGLASATEGGDYGDAQLLEWNSAVEPATMPQRLN